MTTPPNPSPASPPTSSSPPAAEVPPPRGRSRLETAGTVALIGWVLLVAGALGFLWFVADLPRIHAIRHMATTAAVVATLVVLALYLVVSCPARRVALPTGLALFALLGAAAGSIRQVHFTGDMLPTFEFRWQPTREQILVSHRQHHIAPERAAVELPPLTAEDMAEYRGAARDGVVTGPPLHQDWSARMPTIEWKQPCGGGYSSFAVIGEFAVTLEQRGVNESIVCYDTADGRERWAVDYPADFQEALGGPGPRATPTIHDGLVYSQGAMGDLYCLRLEDGEVVWKINILAEHGLENLVWATSSSPLVLGQMLIANAGGPYGKGLVAYDRLTGVPIWKGPGVSEPQPAKPRGNWGGYSSPQRATLAGIEQILSFEGDGLRSYDPANGAILWEYPYHDGGGGDPGINVAQPLVLDGDRVFLSASYGRGCAMLRAKRDDAGWTTETLWKNRLMECAFTSPVQHDGYLYGLNEGMLVCLDAQTGKSQWKKTRQAQYGHGQVLLANGQLVIISEQGEVALVDAAPDAFREIGRLKVLEGEKTWNPHALVRGRLYVRNHLEMACVNLLP